MKTFFTSDHHFGHANIIKFEALNRVDECGLMFSSVEQMDEFLIARWNEVVGRGDLVYHLGDISYKQTTLLDILPRLNGRKILVCGNHDPYFKRMMSGDKGEIALDVKRAQSTGFESIHTELLIDVEGLGKVKLHHFPYAPPTEADELFAGFLECRPEPTGEDLLLHGHVHSQWFCKQYRKHPLMINVGVDTWRLKPLSVEDMKAVVGAYREGSL